MIYLQVMDNNEDKLKFEKIYLEYRGLMFSVANRILNNEYDAEDVVHQAFLSIAERITDIEEAVCSRTKSYVVLIAENKAIDLYRKRAKHPEEVLDDTTEGLVVEYNGDNVISECFLRLPLRYRQILKLKYLLGYRIKEIAEIMDITEINAMKLCKRARKKLKEICDREGLL